jgi:hypothetical protein
MRLFFALTVLAALAPHAIAQQPARPAPADPMATVPAMKYESAFSAYVPYREEKLAPWREVNDEVGRGGGHVGMFRGGESSGQGTRPAPSKPAPGQPAATPSRQPAGQPPVRGEPQGTDSGHKAH